MAGTQSEARSARLPLQEAVERFKRAPGAWSNAYDWWRRSAQERGRISFGNTRQLVAGSSTDVAAFKIGNRWFVELDAFGAAMAEHAEAEAELDFITAEYRDRRLLVPPGCVLRTRWGTYRVSTDFHHRVDAYGVARGGSLGSWICNQCWASADLEHNREECHICRDWGSCGTDCTLTAVSCAICGTRLQL